MRSRIASDLHDDIGANLTKISIMSEVAQQQHIAAGRTEDSQLSSIARISRESVASMSDIVWSINPERDSLRDLVRRMRLHAEEACLPRHITLDFQTPEGDLLTKLAVDARRDLFLIFKEAVNNAVRHSGCSRLEVVLVHEHGTLSLTVRDNGRGFDPSRASEGNGLVNMRRRAEGRHATLDITSDQDVGSRVCLSYANT
jgi:signal transduction histidine kinase